LHSVEAIEAKKSGGEIRAIHDFPSTGESDPLFPTARKRSGKRRKAKIYFGSSTCSVLVHDGRKTRKRRPTAAKDRFRKKGKGRPGFIAMGNSRSVR
jgi:hypothetical protein